MKLPPGQRLVSSLPRFGLGGRPPTLPEVAQIEVGGVLTEPIVLPVAGLCDLPRHEVIADFHCVSGWTAAEQRWEGVRFQDVYDAMLRPRLAPEAVVTHVVLEGLDGYRSVALLADLMAPGVLLADRLDGEPLAIDHGAPVRLLSPAQYGYISTKHLCRIELHAAEPKVRYHPTWRAHLGLQLVKPHPRARVWHEERHRYLPGPVVRPVYHRLIRHFKRANARTP